MSDLRERVPGHSLVDELLRQWDLGTIHLDPASNGIVIDEQAVGWYRGVLGERRVAALLAQLGSEWTVLHSVPVGRGSSDIDHVVIGQAGVFTINTKYSPRKDVWVGDYAVTVDRHSTRYLQSAKHEAERAADLLSRAVGMTVPVIGLIVFVDAGRITRKAAAGGGMNAPIVEVVRDHDLLPTFAARPVFSVEQVERIVARAVLPETWHRAPTPSTAGRHISQEFAALEEAVGPRLAQPVVRRRPAPQRVASSRPPTRRPARRRQSALEKVIRGLVIPLGLVALWVALNHLTQR